ncbi:MAG: hypothetical protein CMJ41_11170 [Phycisphaerae bacterium]|nr:hypothetical protein [Phycisphaerae bacterium]MAA53553.1 hypothetical protein [Phycisphaerae bacterium]
MELYDTEKTRKLEKKLISLGYSSTSLILKAGNAIYEEVVKLKKSNMFIVIGKGNNGADGLSLALLSAINNLTVTCVLLDKIEKQNIDVYNLIKSLNIKTYKTLPKINRINKDIVIIDSILGIGLNRSPAGKYQKAIKWINSYKRKGAYVVSIDVPSGLFIDTGVGSKDTVLANKTIMCLTPKQGCFTGDGIKYSGTLIYKNLGFTNIKKYGTGSSKLIDIKNKVSLRSNNNTYKGNFGKVLILGGWDGMQGAGNLAGLAALKTGAGKVFICNNSKQKKPDDLISIRSDIASFKKCLKIADVVVAGPGLGKNASEHLEMLWNYRIPVVYDADALNWLSSSTYKKRPSYFIGTPHYGEAKKLLKEDFKDRFNAICKLKNCYGGDWILKGPGTLVLTKKLYINDFSNNILSTSGTGDVLAGIVAGLLAQKKGKQIEIAVKIHSLCAEDIYLKKKATLTASEMLENISKVIYNLKNN